MVPGLILVLIVLFIMENTAAKNALIKVDIPVKLTPCSGDVDPP